MNPQDPLQQLRDIHLPAEISWWPPACGWWLLMLLLVIGIAVGILRERQRRQRRAYRRAGQQELELLYEQWQASGDTGDFLQQLNEVLKRTALYSYPGIEIAALSGASWTAFLDRDWDSSNPHQFSGGPLESAPYSGQFQSVDVNHLLQSSLLWLQDHRDNRT